VGRYARVGNVLNAVSVDRLEDSGELKPSSMVCPECGTRTSPLSGSTWNLAWYTCYDCGHFWSARLRDGRPAREIRIDVSHLTGH
jgi:hypothetical protein